MNARRVWTLIRTEVVHGPKDVFVAISVVMPILMALFVNLAFGNIFTERAELGVFDQGQSRIVGVLSSAESIGLKTYGSESAIVQAVGRGAVDMGVVLPPDFDSTLKNGVIRLKGFVWGESLAKSRAVISVVLADAVRTITGSVQPVEIESFPLGDKASVPWGDRLVPLVVLMGVFYGGLMLPSSALIYEKQHRTLEALNVTPATIGDIFVAKGVVAVALATAMGILTLVLSGSFGGSFLLVVLVLVLGAIMATEIGLVVGAYVNDMNSLFTVLKAGGILLFGPALVYMFPQIPSWLGYLFPTYYVVRPVVDLSISGANFGDVAIFITILAALVLLGVALPVNIVRRLSTHALRLNT